MTLAPSATKSSQAHPHEALRSWLPAAAILIVTILAYLPILRAGFIWDDDKHVTANLLLRTAAGLRTLWLDRTALPQYYPLTHTSFWLEYHLWGNRPLGYHAVNLLLHICNAILIWRILRRLAVPGAVLAAIFFAVHPVNVETVGWIAERKNTLSTFFYLLSLATYLRFDQRRRDSFYEAWYSTSLVLFIASLLCKSVTCTFPAAVLLIIWWRDGRLRVRDFVALIPFFAAGALLGLQTAWLERTHVAAAGPEWRYAATIPGEIVARCLIAGRDLWFYLSKLLLPYPLMFEYPRWHINVYAPWQYLFPLVAVLALLSLWLLRKRIGRGPLACMLFFAGTLFPALGFANIYPMRFTFVADHFQYLATIGPLVLIAVGFSRLSAHRMGDFLPPELFVGALMVLTFVRSFSFHDEKILYADSIAKNPNGWMTQTNYGAILGSEGDLGGAETHLLLGLRLHPTNGVAADKLGLIAQARKQQESASEWFQSAIELEPRLAAPHYDLARLLDTRGEDAAAAVEYAAAIQLQPNFAPSRLNYGVLLAGEKQYREAAIQFREALRIDPASDLARRDLIASLERCGQLGEAADQLQELILEHPNDAAAYNNLGLVETARHHKDAAMAAFRHALAVDPEFDEARQHLDALIAPATTQPHVR